MSHIIQYLDFESDNRNWKLPFDKMCQKGGREFIEMLIAMWQANGGCLTDAEFCQLNGLPVKFFENKIKCNIK